MRSIRNSTALRLTLYYIIIAGLWILVTDRLLSALIDPAYIRVWQTYKGWFFVLTTGIIFFVIFSVAIKTRLHLENKLVRANQQLTALISASPLAILTMDRQGRLMSWNTAAERMFGWTEKEVLGCSNPAVPEEKQLEYRSYIAQAAKDTINNVIETTLVKKDGTFLDAGLSLAPIHNAKGETSGIVALISDITEQKKREDQLKYLSLNDALTGIYNRAYFEQEMRRLENSRYESIGMIVCDLDGLKLYNDSLGHAVGDTLLHAAAQLIKSCFRDSDVVARIGGDEFAVLLPGADDEAVENGCKRIKQAIREYNNEHQEYYLSMSAGYAVSRGKQLKLTDLFKEADNNMYKEKLRRGETVREATMQILIRALSSLDYVPEGHTNRMEDLAAVLANKTGIKQEQLPDIRLFAKFHDIGKVGIPENILFKAEPLTQKELEIIKTHPEIGHRIALSAPDLVHLADWILKHHEWWDGGGYPLGLKGREIPLECRILAIIDAYDALTNDRPYRSAKSREDALQELKNFAGKQFDPELVEIFVDLMLKNESHNLPQNA